VVVRIVFFDTLFITNFHKSLITPHSSLSLTLQDIHEVSGGDSSVFAVVSLQDSVQGLAVSRRDEVVSSEVCRHTYKFLVVVDYNFSLTHHTLTELRVS